MDVLRNELKLAFRRLLRARLTTFLALLTLALGIGANSAIFTVVNAVLIRQCARLVHPARCRLPRTT